MKHYILKTCLAAVLMGTAPLVLAEVNAWALDSETLHAIASAQATEHAPAHQETYGVAPHGKSWMVDLSLRYRGGPPQQFAYSPIDYFGVMREGPHWMVDYRCE